MARAIQKEIQQFIDDNPLECLEQIKKEVKTVDDVETYLIQRYSFGKDGAILCKEQLIIWELMNVIKNIKPSVSTD